MMLKYFIGSLVLFLVSAVWFFGAMSEGWKTNSWTAVEAHIGQSEAPRNINGRRTSVKTLVRYKVAGQSFEAYVDDLLVAGRGTVYVNPEDPTQVVGNPGPNLQHYGRPMIITIASGLFVIVLGLIAFSPKEE